VPTVIIFFVLKTVYTLKVDKEKIKPLFLYSLLSLALFIVLTILPLVWFDIRHNFINYNAFKQFFTVRQTTVNLKPYKAVPKLWELTTQIFTRLLAGKNQEWGGWLTALFGLGTLFIVIKEVFGSARKKFFQKKDNLALLLVLAWFLIGLLGLGSYKQHIYDHYFGFFFPVPFLLGALVIREGWRSGWLGKIVGSGLLSAIVILSFAENPFRYPPNYQLAKTEEVARFIEDQAGGQPFNLALIAENNYQDAYAFFMEIWHKPATPIEPLRVEETITDQLFVICEKIPCQPINHPLAEIANFGWAKIDQKWEENGVEVYKLVHNQ
jgi:hypothetical protein